MTKKDIIERIKRLISRIELRKNAGYTTLAIEALEELLEELK